MKSKLLITALWPLALVACSPADEPGTAIPMSSVSLSSVSADPQLPTVDLAAVAASLPAGTVVESLDFAPAGEATVEGEVKGETAPVYALPVAAGQTVTITFEPSNTNLYVNVTDATDTSGAALFRGEMEGQTATMTPTANVVLLIKPFQPRAMARRGESGTYSLKVTRE